MKMLEIPPKKNVLVQFRLTKVQYARLKNMMEAKGYQRVAQYIRDNLLGKDLLFDEKFNAIYNVVMKINKKIERTKTKKSQNQDYLV